MGTRFKPSAPTVFLDSPKHNQAAFKPYVMIQPSLLPPRLDELIPENHLVRVAIGVALLGEFCFTVRITGSVDKAIERLIVAVVLWVICALVWAAVCAVARILA